MTAISTPCRRICVIDPASGLCEGCGRSLAEIGRWSGLSEAGRRAIMAQLPARLKALRQSLAAKEESDGPESRKNSFSG